MSKKLTIIDADSLCYLGNSQSVEEDIQKIKDRVTYMLEATQCDYYTMYVSKGNYFRKNIFEGYKVNRNYLKSPKYSKVLKEFLIAEYGAQWINMCEADDAIAWLMVKEFIYLEESNQICLKEQCVNIELLENSKPVDLILSSPDKDLVKSIPTTIGSLGHLNYSFKLAIKGDLDSVIKGWWITTSEEDAKRFSIFQLISGDVSDNVITPFPESCGVFNSNLTYEEVLKGYIEGLHYETPTGLKKFKAGLGIAKGIFEYQKNYRLLHMLDCDEDFMREVGEIPKLPIINEVIKAKEEITDYV